MSELDERKLQAEIGNLEAQTVRALSDAKKLDAERLSVRKSLGHWTLETIKVVSAIALGAGGVMAAITGYQLSEVRKERTDFETERAKAQLERLNAQKASTDAAVQTAQQQLASIRVEVQNLQASLEGTRKASQEPSPALDDAITRAASIGQAVNQAKAQLCSAERPAAGAPRPQSCYLIGLQTLGVPDETRQALNQRLQRDGYSLHDNSYSYDRSARPAWFAPQSTVFYYAAAAAPAAKTLAAEMKRLTGQDFAVQRGAGLGVDPSQRDVTLYVHYLKGM
jgi:DNA repair exonuclease SbcCD ATPase subunit